MGNLKRIFCLIVAGLWLGAMQSFAHAAPDLLASYHFIGAANLANDTNAAKLREIWALPATVDFRDQVLGKLSQAPGQLLAQRVKSSADHSALIRPLLNDLLAAESRAELRRSTNGPGEGVFAIRLKDEQAGIWQENLSKVFKAWTGNSPREIQSHKCPGWEFKQTTSPNLIRLVRAADWVVIGIGQNELPLMESWLAEIMNQKGLPVLKENHWLEADIDWPRLQDWLPLAKSPLKLARTEIAVSGKNENLRTTVRALYPAKLNWKSATWQIPTNLVRDPIITFTAAQNLSSILNEPQKLQKLSVRPMEDQFFMWAQSQSPFHTAGAMPVANASKALQMLSTELPAVFKVDLENQKAGQFVLATNREVILWQGVPLLAPYLRVTNDFLFGGLPSARLTNLPPPELIAQVSGRTNLIYYDWEITQERMGQWQLLGQILPPFVPERSVPAGHPTTKVNTTKTDVKNKADANQMSKARLRHLDQTWQSAVGKYLGNTITEITLAAPNEVNVLRKSPIGFTGFELVMLTRWMNHPEFPLFGYKLPPADAKK